MRYLYWATLVSLTVLAGCGNVVSPADNNTGANANTSVDASSLSIPAIRAIVPPDLDGDQTPDVIVHPALQRFLVQAPTGSGFSLTRDGADVPFSVTLVTLDDGTALHELELESPVGDGDFVLRAGDYALAFTPDDELGEHKPLTVHPSTPGALANDLANPTGVLFPSTDGVALALSGGIPSLAGEGLVLRSGEGRQIPLRLTMRAGGLRAQPASAPAPRTMYRLHADADSAAPYDAAPGFSFHLTCRGRADDYPIRLKTADLNRDGDEELISLFANGTVTALTDPDGRAEGILPAGEDTALDFAIGDFDGNGASDLVILLHGQEGFRLLYLYNQTRVGEARFAMQSDVLTLESPIALEASDFDRDGRDDLAILGAFGEVLIQYSGRTAQLFPGLPERKLSSAIRTVDANADGKPDLYVMAADGTGQLALNVGGGFNPQLGVQALDMPGALRVETGHLDADRDGDLVFTGASRHFYVVLDPQTEPAMFTVQGIEEDRLAGAVLCKDVNRNSRTDILLALEDEQGICDEIALYLNDSDSRGTPDAVLPLGARVEVHALEFWKENILLASSAGLLILEVNPGVMPPTVDSKVRFVEAYTPVPQIPAPLAAAIADFNDDGRSDLATIDRDGNLQVWLSGADGEPFEPSGEPIPLGSGGTLQAIDFDRDSAPDLLFIPDDPMVRPRLLRNNREGGFNDEGLLPTPPSDLRGPPAMGDFDRDGDLDVLWPSPLGTLQMKQDSRWDNGTTLPAVRLDAMRLNFSGELTCADFTGDGIDDVVAVMEISRDDEYSQFLVLFEGTGVADDPYRVFKPTITTGLKGRFFGLSPADFNGDGRLDLAVGYGTTDQPSRLTLLRLGPGRQFQIFEGSPQPRGVLLDIALDDLDRDGNLDLITSESLEDGTVRLTLWINDGRGGFGEATEAQRSLVKAIGDFRATNLSLSDFTGDGRPDLMAIDRDGNVVIVRTTLP